MTTTTLSATVYQATLGSQVVRFRDRSERNELYQSRDCIHVLDRTASRAKGAADILGNLSRGFNFAGHFVPESATAWTSHVSSFTGRARTALCIPYFLTVANRCKDNPSTRNLLEVGSVGCLAASLFPLEEAIGKGLGSVGSTFKIGVDAFDFADSFKKASNFSELGEIAATTGASPEVRSGLDSQWWSQVCRIGRFALAVISGTIAFLGYAMKIALPPYILMVGLVASVASIIFSFAAELVSEGARYVPVPLPLPPVV